MARQTIADIRKKEILATFYEVARTEGLENTSFAKIAEHLEIQPSLIVHYFKNRNELILSLIQYNLDQYRQIFMIPHQEDLSHKAHLLMVIDKIFSKDWNDLFDDGVYYSCYALIFRDPSIRKKFRDLHIELRNQIENLINNCVNEGSLLTSDTGTLAQHIANILDGAYYFIGMLDDAQAQDDYLQQTRELIHTLLFWQ